MRQQLYQISNSNQDEYAVFHQELYTSLSKIQEEQKHFLKMAQQEASSIGKDTAVEWYDFSGYPKKYSH